MLYMAQVLAKGHSWLLLQLGAGGLLQQGYARNECNVAVHRNAACLCFQGTTESGISW